MTWLLISAALVWFGIGFYSLGKLLKEPVHPIGDALLGFVLLAMGPIGWAIVTLCEWELARMRKRR